jgi:hypothetical protein
MVYSSVSGSGEVPFKNYRKFFKHIGLRRTTESKSMGNVIEHY